MKPNDGGPAFPQDGMLEMHESQPMRHPGMSLRDWFAGMALQGFMANHGWLGYFENKKHRQFLIEGFSKDSYAVADAMLAERTKA